MLMTHIPLSSWLHWTLLLWLSTTAVQCQTDTSPPPSTSSSGDNSTTTLLPPPAPTSNVSAQCSEALQGSAVSPPCASTPPNGTPEAMIAGMCGAPSDGDIGHFCSTDQINTALDTIEARCSGSDQSDALVQASYTMWYTYSLSAAVLCVKGPSGQYCALDASTVANNSTGTECTPCMRAQLEATTAWRAPRKSAIDQTVIDEATHTDAELLHQCGVSAAAATRPSLLYYHSTVLLSASVTVALAALSLL